jgi:hypothetical protein
MVEGFLPVIPAEAGIQGCWVALEYMSVTPWSPLFEGRGAEGVSGREEVGTARPERLNSSPVARVGPAFALTQPSAAFACMTPYGACRGAKPLCVSSSSPKIGG